MKKVVITGATSFIGVHLIQYWLETECEIYAVIRENSSNIDRIPQNVHVHIIECNMNEYNLLNQQVLTADYFYHLAWEGSRAPHRDNEVMQKNNYDCALKAMDAAMKMGCSFFLGSGSQAEYGSTNGLVDENYPCNPNTAYGKEKLHACNDLMNMAKSFNMKFIWTRVFSIYGKYDYSGTLIMSCLSKMQKNEPIKMTACTQLWDYLYVKDAARAMLLFSDSNCESGVYNLASGDYRPLKEFIIEMREVVNSDSKLEFGAVLYGPNGPINLTPNSDKIKRTLNWTPEVNFAEGIKRLVRLT